MATPNVLVLTGYGINCDKETKFAFEEAGAKADLVHINDLIEIPEKLDHYQIIALPGGFSFGDDTGSGNALAWKIRDNLGIERLLKGDKLIIGICNGFQDLVNLGILPALDNQYGTRQVALTHNKSARYSDRWVDLEVNGESPWVYGIKKISLPIAHAEGNFYTTQGILHQLNEKNLVAARYIEGEICEYQNLPANPNGSLENIASITDETRKIIGMMPHPERCLKFTHLPNWPILKEKFKREKIEIPRYADGMKIFINGVNYFK